MESKVLIRGRGTGSGIDFYRTRETAVGDTHLVGQQGKIQTALISVSVGIFAFGQQMIIEGFSGKIQPE